MSEMTTSIAVAEAQKWGNLIRALSRLSEVAEYLNAQEQVQAERQGKLATLQKEIVEAIVTRDRALAAAPDIVSKAKAEAARIVEAANASARAALENAEAAHADARKAKDDAERYQDLASEAETAAARARDELRETRSAIAAAKADAIKQLGG